MQLHLGFLCLLAHGAHAAEVDVTPVQKVVQLMGAMLEKGKKEKNEEEVGFAQKTQFCVDTKADKNKAIEDEKQAISGLKAKIASQTEKIARLTKTIASNQKDADAWSGDVKAATKVRKLERSDFENTNRDYGESIDALGRAIATLKAKTADKTQAKGSLLQVSSLEGFSLIPESAKKALDAFIQEGQAEHEFFAASAPPGQANAYEFQSQGVVDMLSKLEDKFVQERTTLQKEETSTKHAHLMLLQNLNSQIAEAKKDITDHTQDKMKTTQAKAGAESDLNEQNKLLASDTKYLKDLTASCAMEKSEFEAGQQMRADELVAIEKAVSIISSGSVAGKATQHFTLLQQKKAPSLGQLRSTSDDAQIQGRVAKFLHARAAKFHSRVLETLALRASADPMKKVKNMVKDLLVKLMEESSAEADHKGFCDTAIATNQATRTEKTNEVQDLSREIDQTNAAISKLTSEVAKLNKQVASLDKAMAKSTEIRIADKAKNKNTVTDSQEAQEAVAQALTVLKEFYEKAADAAGASFVQAPYTGMGSENGGVTGMLEVIESDFARLEAETKATETTDQKEYDEFMTDSGADKAGKKAAIQHKSTKKAASEQALNVLKNDLDGTQKELNAALNVFEKLKPSCVNSGVSYEDRVAKRKEEIQSMKEALQVLEGNDVE